jgi:hypothetical protein
MRGAGPPAEGVTVSGAVFRGKPALPRRRRGSAIVGVAVVVAAAAVLGIEFIIVEGLNRPVPQFASLAKHPDRSLQGTVAYYADRSRCVKIVAAAGRPSKTVFCLPEMDVATAVKEGKEVGPQLV